FLAAESTQLHLEFRRQTHSISASELPLVFGLFLVAPGTLLVVRLAAAALVMIVRRRPPLKIFFNLCLFSAETTLALVTFRAVLVGRPVEVTEVHSWVAAAAAVGVVFVVSNVSVLAAIAISGSVPPWREVASALVPAFMVTVLNAALALVVLLTLSVSAWAALPLALLGVMIFLGYRGWLRSRAQHRMLNRVYRFSRLLEQVRGMEGPLEVALEEARASVNASVVRLGLLDDGELLVTEIADGPSWTARRAGPADHGQPCRPPTGPPEGIGDGAGAAAGAAGARDHRDTPAKRYQGARLPRVAGPAGRHDQLLCRRPATGGEPRCP